MDINAFYSRHNSRHRIRAIVASLYLITALIYMSWRLTVFNTEHLFFSVCFYLAEFTCFVLALQTFFIYWKIKIRKSIAPESGLKIDVYVPTYNESVEMLRRTIKAAIQIDYPHETWLLDDGRRSEMKALADELGCHYLVRPDNAGHKAGNLNHALVNTIGDFILVLDSDHVAQRNILDRLMGYFKDPDVALVQTPQDYYNTSAFQFRNDKGKKLLWHDQGVFYQVGQAGRDYLNATSSCGTGVVYRRKVIDKIGGFPTETLTEDMHTAIRIQKLDYKTVYHPEPLAFGVAPTDLGEYQRQRLRWAQGNIQTIREEELPFCKGLTLAQKFSYLYLATMYLEGWVRFIFYLTPVIVLTTGIGPIGYTEVFFYYFLPYFLMSYLFFEELTRGSFRYHINEELCMARFPVYMISIFAYFRKNLKWYVSSKYVASKDFVGNLPILQLIPQIIVLCLSVFAVLKGVLSPPEILVNAYSKNIIYFVVFWGGVNAVLAYLVIWDSIRCSKEHKYADYRFKVPFPIKLIVDDEKFCFGVVSEISGTGMKFKINNNNVLPEDGTMAGCLYLPSGQLPMEVKDIYLINTSKVFRINNVFYECKFDWRGNIKGSETLDMILHSCDWYRRFKYYNIYFDTPLEKFIEMFFVGIKSKRLILEWVPMLYTFGEKNFQSYEFGLIAKDNISKEFNHIMTFKELLVKDKIYVNCLDSTNEITNFEIIKMKEGKNPDAPGIDPVSVYEYIVKYSLRQEHDALISWEEIQTLEV